MRVEDLDPPRVVAGAAVRVEEDLAWLGLDWDEAPAGGGAHAPYTQSQRGPAYEAALAELADLGLTYFCDCSRKEIAQVASAPHPGEEAIYPGTCRDASPTREFRRPPATRLRIAPGLRVSFDDLVRGSVTQVLDTSVGDFVLRRGDGPFAYQLAVTIDDIAMGITHVVRADDLLLSTPRQIHLATLLGASKVPAYAHVPLVVETGGDRLAKRAGATTIRSLREGGVSAETIIGALAHGLGLVTGPLRELSARDVASALVPPETWRKDPWTMPETWLAIARAQRSAK